MVLPGPYVVLYLLDRLHLGQLILVAAAVLIRYATILVHQKHGHVVLLDLEDRVW